MTDATMTEHTSPLLLLGMHRSGTSALVNLLGDLQLRGPKDPLPAAPDNPDGYGESLSIINANNAILQARLGTWDAPPVVSSASDDEVQLTAQAFASAYDEVGHQPLVLKDPRICVLMPIWRAALGGGALKTIVLFRHPDRVVASLLHHNRGVSQLHAAVHANALWERYNRAMVEGLVASDELLICDFDALVEDVAYRSAWLERLVGFLPASLGHDLSHVSTAFLSRFATTTKVGSSSQSVATPQQLRLYDELRAMANSNVLAPLDTPETPGLQALFSFVHAAKVTVPSLETALSAVEKSLEEQTKARNYVEGYSNGQQRRIEALDEQIAAMEQTLSWRVTKPLRSVQQRRRQGS